MLSVKRPVVVVADNVAHAALARLTEDGFDVHDLHEGGIQEKRLTEILTELSAVALIVRSATRVTDSVLRVASGFGLRVVARAGVGLDNIDCHAAKVYGVLVVNAPEGNTISAVEHTCALMLSLARQFPTALLQRPNEWPEIRKLVTGDSARSPVTELCGKTLGIIGLGRIGSAVGQRMHAFGMRILGCDPSANFSSRELPYWLSDVLDLESMLPNIDYLTIHVPLLPETRALLNSNSLALCRPGFRIINCSRGGIVHEDALLASLEAGHCAAAALDVFEYEPLDSLNPVTQRLCAHQSVLCTPHLGASSQEAQVRVAIEVSDAIRALNASPHVRRCGLEGAVNINLLGRQCLLLFPTWLNSFGPLEAHNPFYLISAIHYLLKQFHASSSYLDSQATMIYRITASVPLTSDNWIETKLLLAELIAHVCRRTASHSSSFFLSSLFLQSDTNRPEFCMEDPVTGVIKVTWGTTTAACDSICSVLFVHSISSLNTVERQLFGGVDRHWQLALSIQSIQSPEITSPGLRFPTKVAYLRNGHVHLFNSKGMETSEGLVLHSLI
ncbi:D-3-phosphoglycerate dehydrogenase [Fasciolopsis buskii]|uniref:D-3-phosphoglycerate dehydrogenase n=1 Tax=Fasciolopsis buskii TaxID=27845 RepID=A0A8E0RLB5_9TREM|nr:D-3-phosphoglycerate dehydrogenase [Fasciolopsis buski]